MTRKEVIDVLHENTHCKKKDLRNVRNMVEQGRKAGYMVVKIGPDNYYVKEICAIQDFSKPIKIKSDLQSYSPFEVCNGVPLASIIREYAKGKSFSIYMYCYLFNKRNGDRIIFPELYPYMGRDDMEIAKGFDYLSSLGYLKEKEDCIEFYLQPQAEVALPIRFYEDPDYQRVAPIVR